MKNMTQDERLLYLIESLRAESEQYGGISIPDGTEDRRRLLRALMNVRPPMPVDERTLKIQDEYLKERAREKGTVGLNGIPTVREALQSAHPHGGVISIWQGDITRLACDAIVNAANSQMLGCFAPLHACIDNAIHTYAGVELRAECHRQMEMLRKKHGADYEQPTAEPMLTDAYNLPSRKVVHIVGPIVDERLTPAHEAALADCYKNTLDMCREYGLESVAFCCISTGVFRFPNARAAEIAVQTASGWLSRHEGAVKRVIFNVFKDEDKAHYEALLS